jgi:predicted RNase H-like HicB family nuclease
MTASNRSRTVHLTYNHEEGSWWAESEQLPGLFAGGDSLDEAKELTRQVIREELGADVTTIEWVPMPSTLERTLVGSPGEESGSLAEKAPGGTLNLWPDEEGLSVIESDYVFN